ncbi:hypothetical protein AQUCO_08800004v1 [Aquilegia coerulea]|uniref:Uncharacterized protein n=1 Tax=Aquilegia coerulea TaxID=218851 RepID=A0A2G5C681_AQUCA|nr:hypothetical protein AQUCO_08800004v1 [Aquilegia coerulea]
MYSEIYYDFLVVFRSIIACEEMSYGEWLMNYVFLQRQTTSATLPGETPSYITCQLFTLIPNGYFKCLNIFNMLKQSNGIRSLLKTYFLFYY